jgi:5-methylcytosine-specific restriction endonuclease McrBC GTP-binding regulatory subunit McrB
VPSGLQTIRAVGIVEGDYFFDAQAPILYSQFRKVRWLYRDISYPVKTVYGRQFSVQTVYAMDKSALEEGLLREHDHRPASNNYVLIIDEINRGNVSRIFGELITLLETDKRLGQPEALTVTLPYSRETFGVPDNLYLIGTMNTADRSVEALDSALRRRFTFREITARPEVLTGREVAGVGLEQLLGTINGRVERLLDKDHLIGHAYFLFMPLTIAGLREVFARQLIPLLEEYFFGDSHKLRLVLGNGFFTRLEEPAPFAPDTNEDFATDEPDYRLIDPATMTDGQFIDAIERLL